MTIPACRLGHVRRDAFTLIEILVVLAIIGILAALLMPLSRRMAEAADWNDFANNYLFNKEP